MGRGEETPEREEDASLGWRRYFSVSLDHKVIGMQYLTLALILFAIGGMFALIFRTDLAQPSAQFLTPIEYNTLMSLHGIVMIIGILIGISAIMNYTVPLLIGANDMAFPRLERLFVLDRRPGRRHPALEPVHGRVRYRLDRLPAALAAGAARDPDVLPGRLAFEFFLHT